jgi:hypothetical protein
MTYQLKRKHHRYTPEERSEIGKRAAAALFAFDARVLGRSVGLVALLALLPLSAIWLLCVAGGDPALCPRPKARGSDVHPF